VKSKEEKRNMKRREEERKEMSIEMREKLELEERRIISININVEEKRNIENRNFSQHSFCIYISLRLRQSCCGIDGNHVTEVSFNACMFFAAYDITSAREAFI